MMNFEFNETELRRLDLNALLVFAALMRERSVTRAAARLFVGPPAVSMALTKLRELLGDPLFVRAGGAMEPTPRSVELYQRIGPALAEIDDVVRNAGKFDPATAERTIRFASPDDLEVVLVPTLLRRLAKDAPNIRLIIRSADFRVVPQLLDNGEADLALTATPPELEKRHRHKVLYDDGFVMLYDPRRTRLKKPIDLDAYLSVPHVFLSTRGDMRGPIDDMLTELGRRRQILASVPRFSTIPFILRARASLVNMPRRSAGHYAKLFKLEMQALPFKSARFDVSLVWHLRSEGDEALQWFRTVLEECVRELAS